MATAKSSMGSKKQLRFMQQKQQGTRVDQQLPLHPLPIVIESLSGFPAREDAWPCYHAVFTGHSIIVPFKEDARALALMGCFGSKLHASPELKILRQRQYDRRLAWDRFFQDRRTKQDSSDSEEELEVPDISVLRVPEDDEAPQNSVPSPKPLPDPQPNNVSADGDIIVEQEVLRPRATRGWFLRIPQWITAKEEEETPVGRPESPQVIEVDDEITILSDTEENGYHQTNHQDMQDDDIEILSEEPKDTGQPTEDATKESDNEEEEMRLQVSDDESQQRQGEPMNVEESKARSEPPLDNDVAVDSVVVINDTDCNGNRSSLLRHWDPKLKPAAFPQCDEAASLSLEEGFFLSWALNCLQVSAPKSILCEYESHNRSSPQPGPSGLQINEALIDLTPSFLWELFSQSQPNFPLRYAVYHHLRAKGWVVKSGYKMGGDFVIYKDSPSLYHASAIVVVESETKLSSWQDLLTLNRIAESTSKDIVICRLSWPQDCHMDAIDWLSKVAIVERVFQRHSLKKGSLEDEGSENEYSDSSDL